MGQFRIIIDIIRLSDVATFVQAENAFTLFAPVDAASSKYTSTVIERLRHPKFRNMGTRMVSHLVSRNRYSCQFLSNMNTPITIRMLSDIYVKINKIESTVEVDDATIVTSGMFVGNGVVYGIDNVFLPSRS